MGAMSETRPLDPLTLLMAQLGRIEKSIEALPAVVARLDALSERLGALTESTRQLEIAWRENVRDLSLRDAEQQRAIEELRLRVSEVLAGVAGMSATLQETRGTQADGLRRLVVVERQVAAAMDAHSQLNLRVRAAEERQGDPEFRTRLTACAEEFAQWRPLLAELAGVIATVREYLPWWRGLKWALGIVGGLLLTALATGILWAIIQSGGGL